MKKENTNQLPQKVSGSLLVDNIKVIFSWYGIDMKQWKFDEIKFEDGVASVFFKGTKKRKLKCSGFKYNETTGDITEYSHPVFG